MSPGRVPISEDATRVYPPLIVIAGATATGKTGLSIRLAQSIPGAEIISADSRQVYRGLDIGTAKVPAADRGGIPHHGLDLVEPDAPFSVADFAPHADAVLAALGRRPGVAILVGGTGLYLRAVARGLPFGDVPSDAAVRARIEVELASTGLPALAARVRRLAPNLAAHTDLRNPRRVARALEIAELQGDRPLPAPRGYPGPALWLGLSVDRAVHRGWIAERAGGQFAAGLIEEAAALRARYPAPLRSLSAIGYPEAFGVLAGRLTLDEAIAEDVRRNIAFARRQQTWFRAESGIEWFDATSADPLAWARARARALIDPVAR